jgi:hypothetical protein
MIDISLSRELVQDAQAIMGWNPVIEIGKILSLEAAEHMDSHIRLVGDYDIDDNTTQQVILGMMCAGFTMTLASDDMLEIPNRVGQ